MQFSKAIGVLAGALVCLLATGASAVEVKQKAEIKGKPADVWAKVGGFCAIKTWHPAITDCAESKEGDVVRRVLTLKDGAKIREKLTGMTKDSYSYFIEESPLPVKNYNATFAMKPDDDDDDEVNIVWSAKFEASGKSDTEAAQVIEGIFSAGLKGIKDLMRAAKAK